MLTFTSFISFFLSLIILSISTFIYCQDIRIIGGITYSTVDGLNIEEEFEIEIPDDEVAEMPTVKSMLNYLTSQGIS